MAKFCQLRLSVERFTPKTCGIGVGEDRLIVTSSFSTSESEELSPSVPCDPPLPFRHRDALRVPLDRDHDNDRELDHRPLRDVQHPGHHVQRAVYSTRFDRGSRTRLAHGDDHLSASPEPPLLTGARGYDPLEELSGNDTGLSARCWLQAREEGKMGWRQLLSLKILVTMGNGLDNQAHRTQLLSWLSGFALLACTDIGGRKKAAKLL
ncbi:hypothetical protein B0H13DRAFT_1869742 [Mycena leptocephala]|nr:hypothetical protein B0H13DRAFT_1869742 [Mycena leptocephala]